MCDTSGAAPTTRRGFLRLLAVSPAVLAGCAQASSPIGTAPASAPANAHARATDVPIPAQPADATPAAFARYAAEMRRDAIASGDQAYGAIIVKDGRVVGLGPSRVMVNRDATAHAEMEAIRDASRRLNTADLSGCVMYSTSPPCRMCEAAAHWARVSRMYVGDAAADAGAPQLGAC